MLNQKLDFSFEFEFLFVMLNQKLDFSFFESFIYNKNWCFCPFYKF